MELLSHMYFTKIIRLITSMVTLCNPIYRFNCRYLCSCDLNCIIIIQDRLLLPTTPHLSPPLLLFVCSLWQYNCNECSLSDTLVLLHWMFPVLLCKMSLPVFIKIILSTHLSLGDAIFIYFFLAVNKLWSLVIGKEGGLRENRPPPIASEIT